MRKKLKQLNLFEVCEKVGNKIVVSDDIAEQVIKAFSEKQQPTGLQTSTQTSLQEQLAILKTENEKLWEALAREQAISYEMTQKVKLLETPSVESEEITSTDQPEKRPGFWSRIAEAIRG